VLPALAGWSSATSSTDITFSVLPALAGVVPRPSATVTRTGCAPRARGVVPSARSLGRHQGSDAPACYRTYRRHECPARLQQVTLSLPSQVLLTAIVILADWIASNDARFLLWPLSTLRQPPAPDENCTTDVLLRSGNGWGRHPAGHRGRCARPRPRRPYPVRLKDAHAGQLRSPPSPCRHRAADSWLLTVEAAMPSVALLPSIAYTSVDTLQASPRAHTH
jgi:hypothetical protein